MEATTVLHDGLEYNSRADAENYKIYAVFSAPFRVDLQHYKDSVRDPYIGGNFSITFHVYNKRTNNYTYERDPAFINDYVMRQLGWWLDLSGKNAVVLGRSNVIGKPVAMLLLAKNATVTVCHSRTQNLKEVCKNADVLVSAIGKAHFVTKDFVKEGAIVVDVGTNYDENGKVTGDVHFDEVSEIASYINPVPGGIGSITTSVLAEKCLIAARKKVK